MIKQITTALQESKSDYVFFCEHDCLYPSSHFDFTPPKNDTFYYNSHVWRWRYQSPHAITYDRLICLSGLCANRNLALKHYQHRLQKITDQGLESIGRHEPDWARKWGYEPGTKKTRRGGFSNDDFETWKSRDPIIDIRHTKTFSPPKVTLESFKHPPQNWRQISVDKIPYWNLSSLFNINKP